MGSEDNDTDPLTMPLDPTVLKRIIIRVCLGGAVEEEC